MILVQHRINTRAGLQQVPPRYGIEMDIRSQGSHLVLHHDPFQPGEALTDWIQDYRHALLILNVKEEGLEEPVLAIMRERNIDNFFFLDQSFPFLMRTVRRGERRCAARVSEFESVATALSLAGQIDWVWVDCFTRFPLDRTDYHRLREAGLRLCLVSPELQGRTDTQEIMQMRTLLDHNGMFMDAVCTKYPDRWQ
ncbi:MAG: hypothetical protein H7833_05200 [Magnetococcus sp. DMHC-1]|nr:hypothetical protein [Magnetococcales bacterium]